MKEYKAPSPRFLWQFLNKNIGVLKARLGLSKKVVTLPVPALNETVTVNITTSETVITFSSNIKDDFTLELQAPKSNIGDKVYVMLTGAASVTITASGNLVWNPCGDNGDPLSISNGQTLVVHCLFNGTNFYGTEYC